MASLLCAMSSGKMGVLRTSWWILGRIYCANDDQKEGFPTIIRAVRFDDACEEIVEHVEEEGLPLQIEYQYCDKVDSPDYEGGSAPAAYRIADEYDESKGEDCQDNEKEGYDHKNSKRPAESCSQSVCNILLEIVCPQTQVCLQD